MEVRNCGLLTRVPLSGTWYRAIDPAFLATAIQTAHTPRLTTRFSPGTALKLAFEILYLAENPMVALFEAGALFGNPSKPGGVVPNPARPLVTLPITVRTTAAIDLTDPSQATLIETNAQELTGDWDVYGLRPVPPSGPPHTGKAPTQELGEELCRLAATKAFISFSAKLPNYKVLAIFTQHLVSPSDQVTYTYYDPSGNPISVAIP